MGEDNQANCELETVLVGGGCEVEVSPVENEGGPLKDGQASDARKHKADSFLCKELSKQLDEIPAVEGKIRFCLDTMQQALSREGAPCFRDFWNARQLCLSFFKESISPKLRSQLWGLYVELSSESKRLKEILDEQSAFASEQIELAIQALEKDVEQREELVLQVSDEPLFVDSIALKERQDFYHLTQRKIKLFNTLASRINALRKEVLKTEMRIRIKNKFLSRLSACGDVIFPQRKEWIHQISTSFMEDVDHFVVTYFQDEEFCDAPLYSLREEVKQLQLVAKVVTLGNQAFTEARLKLSQCWDKMKEKEKERRLQTQQKRQVFKQNFDLVTEKICPFEEACKVGISAEECEEKAAEILQFMRTVELGREEVLALKEHVFRAKRAPQERARQEDLERQKKEEEKEVKRREAFHFLKKEVEGLLQQMAEMDMDSLSSKMQELMLSCEQLVLLKAEKQMWERYFKQIKETIQEKKTQALLSLSEEDLQVLEQLKIALEEHQQRRQEIKKQQEHCRKLLGGSGLDFEKAMLYREMIDAEKVALEKVNAVIEEIEEKIQEIEA